FKPTAESIPPSNVELRQNRPNAPANFHPLNPLFFLLRAAQIHPGKLALAEPDSEQPVYYSYAVWTQRVQNLAYALIQRGIRPGDRVAVLAPNSPMIADAHHGVLAARAIITPINTRLTHREVAYILEHSGAALLLVDREFLDLVKGCRVPMVVCHDTGRVGCPYEAFLSEGRKFSQERGWLGLDAEEDENAAAVLCYTSGTTGRPKGVITTLRGSYLAAIANAYEGQINSESTYLWILPMFHAAGWTFPWANTFAFATQITLRTVNYDLIWKHLLTSSVSHYCAAPTVQLGIVNHPRAKKPTQSVTAIIAGGAAPTAHLLAELDKKGITPVHVYGLTSTAFTRNYAGQQPSWENMSSDDRSRIIARQGHGFATSEEMRVVHQGSIPLVDVPKDGKTLGEIITRGESFLSTYFKDPSATRSAFEGGYFHTGDLAVMHEDGSVAILDRSKATILFSAFSQNILTMYTELSSHPHVLEVSVVAKSHPKWGERPMAFVILHPQHAAKWKNRHQEFAADLKKHAKSRLPGFACPEWVEIVLELPKTSTGKILKTELRKRIAKL
ncbi:hypothetical protein C8J56DRAFT_773009, partial [Mycena floridula]